MTTRRIRRPNPPEPPAQAFLNRAREFHSAANTLFSAGTYTGGPLYFLYTHTIELAFKAYLRSFGRTIPRLHALPALRDRCKNQGLQMNLDLENVTNLLESENEVHGFRYFAFKSTAIPEINFLREVVESLLATVTEEVQKRSVSSQNRGAVIKLTVGKPTSQQPVRP